MRFLVPLLLVAVAVAGRPLAKTDLFHDGPAPSVRTGAVVGTVRTFEGAPLANANVELLGTQWRAVTDDEGAFALDLVVAGTYTLRVTRDGFREARGEVRVPDDSVVSVAVAMENRGQRLGAVRIVEKLRNRVHGVVLDHNDRPMPGVRVGFLGAHRSALTDEQGRFSAVDLPSGIFLMEVREVGYQLSRHSIHVKDDIDREFTIRLQRGRRALSKFDVANLVIVEREAGSREGFRPRANTVVIGREQLEPYGRIGLDFALQQIAPAFFNMRMTNQACVLVDGVRPLGISLGGVPSTPPPGVTLGRQPLQPAGDQGELRRFFADRVERVEIFPVNTDPTRTLCGRFSGASGCGCQPNVANLLTVVIWERR